MFEVETKVSLTPEALKELTHLKCTCSAIFTVVQASSNFVRLTPPIPDIEGEFTHEDFAKKFLKQVQEFNND